MNGDMILTIFGFVWVVLAILWFVFKLYIAVDAARCPFGGGGVPTLDGAIFPPIALVAGLWAIRKAHPEWGMNLLVVWFVVTAFASLVHFMIGRFVRKRPKKSGANTGKSRAN